MNVTYMATCTCGFRREGLPTQVAAEVHADVHESKIVRRAYQHTTTVLQEAR